MLGGVRVDNTWQIRSFQRSRKERPRRVDCDGPAGSPGAWLRFELIP